MEETEPEMAKTQEPVSQVRNTGLDHTVYCIYMAILYFTVAAKTIFISRYIETLSPCSIHILHKTAETE